MSDKEQILAGVALLWMLTCLGAAVYCFVIWQPALVVGLVIASLAPAPFFGDTDAS